MRFTAGGIREGRALHRRRHPQGAAGHDVCFIHPKGDDASPIGGQGVLIELVQAPPAVIEALSRAD